MFGEVSTGAADDLQRATEIAREMATRYGMSQALGNRVYARPRQAFLNYPGLESEGVADETAREIDLEVRNRVDQGFAKARGILEERRADLEAGATLLLEREVLTAEEFPPIRPAAPRRAAAQ